MRKTVYVDLRNRRRITLNEAKALWTAASIAKLMAREKKLEVAEWNRILIKLKDAIDRAEHECPLYRRCDVCGRWPMTSAARAELIQRLRPTPAPKRKPAPKAPPFRPGGGAA